MGFERFVIGPEVTPGVSPGAGVIFPITSHNWGRQSEYRSSTENVSDLTSLPSREVKRTGGGDINFELRLGVINAYLEALCLSSFSAPLAITGNISATASDNSFNGTGLFTSVVKGQWVQVDNLHADFEDSSGRPLPHLVIDKPSNDKIIVATDILTDRAGSGDETVKGSYMRRGGTSWTPTVTTLAVENQFRPGSLYGATEQYQLGLFQHVNTMRFGARVGEILTGTMGLVGSPPADATGSAALTASNPPASKIIDPVRGVPYAWEGTFASPTVLRKSQITLEWNNQFEGVQDLGSLAIASVSKAPPVVSATVSVNRESNGAFTLLNKQGSLSKFAYMFRDLLGQELIVTLPVVSVQPPTTGIPGNTGARYDDVRLVAERDEDSSSPFYGVSQQFDFFAA